MAQQPLRGFTITLRHITLGLTPLDEWSALFRDLIWQNLTLTKERHPWPLRDSNPQFQQVSGRRPTDGAATGTGFETYYHINPLNAELNPICHLLALLGVHFLHVSRIRVKSLNLRPLMSYIYIYIYMEHPFLMFLDHTQRRTTVGRTPLDEWSARRRDL